MIALAKTTSNLTDRQADLGLIVSSHLQLRGFSRQGTKAEESPFLGNVTVQRLLKIIIDGGSMGYSDFQLV
jgi:hypothetical protein